MACKYKDHVVIRRGMKCGEKDHALVSMTCSSDPVFLVLRDGPRARQQAIDEVTSWVRDALQQFADWDRCTECVHVPGSIKLGQVRVSTEPVGFLYLWTVYHATLSGNVDVECVAVEEPEGG